MGVKRIDANRAKELLETGGGYTFIDVRTPAEFADEHVPSAQNIPILLRGEDGVGFHKNEGFLTTMESRFTKTCKVILGCAKGGRSTKAADALSEAGYTNIFDMRGGLVGETDPFGKVLFPGWKTRGLPTTADAEGVEVYPG